ncbi:MAG: COG1470 family protein [Minisyncoccota bacterium]
MADEMKSRIAELEKELYGRDFKPHDVADMLKQKEPVAIPSWDDKSEARARASEEERARARYAMIKKIVYISGGFFVFAALVAVVVWWRGSNIISGDNIKIETVAPLAVAGGEPFETIFTVTNGNKVAIESATLFLEYPAGFYTVTDRVELPRILKELGTIAPGQSVTERVNTILYGEENAQREVNIILEYRTEGSNATLKKEAKYAVRVSSSPVKVKLDMIKEVPSGQDVEFMVTFESNSKDPLEGLLLETSYPSGFTFQGADVSPTQGNNVWNIGTLAPQEKRTIKIRGVIEGQENEEKVMRVLVGTPDLKDERRVGVVYNSITETLVLSKPFLALDISINNDHALEYAAPLGRGVRVDVYWQSNSPTPVTDATIEVALKGDALNRYSVYADGGGFYRSVDNSIVWNKSVSPELASIKQGDRGVVSFSFSPIPLGIDTVRTIKNPQIAFEVRAQARTSGAVSLGTVSTFASRKVKFETDIRLTAQSLYFTGPFQNTGALPPKADHETTYTIKWIVRNASNNVSGATVKTTLPTYIKWLGNISPMGEDIVWDASNMEVSWNAGRIPAGGTREAAFQISFLPSLSQLNKVPYLTGDSTLTAVDDFTKTNLSDRKAPVTTNLSSDPQFSQNQAVVVQ